MATPHAMANSYERPGHLLSEVVNYVQKIPGMIKPRRYSAEHR